MKFKFEAGPKIKTTILLLLMNIPMFAQALENTDGKNMEDLKLLAQANEKKIVLSMNEKGQKGSMGNVDIKRWISPDGQEIIVGYDSKGKEKWLTHEEKDASKMFLDSDLDGVVDRMVLNKTGENKNKESAFNTMKIFSSIDQLGQEAEVEASLDPEKVSIFEIQKDENGLAIKAVNFSTGETEELKGEEAKKYVKALQGMFTDFVEKTANEME